MPAEVFGQPVAETQDEHHLRASYDNESGSITIYRSGSRQPLVVQNARSNFRPYLHPIKAPDGNGVLTQLSPGHHTHQTGLYWGFTRVNGRDFFHNPGADYWRRVSAEVTEAEGDTIAWRTVYHLLDEEENAIMREQQDWQMTHKEDTVLLDLEWKGEALTNITVGEYNYGGLFLRMPWREGIEGEVVNAARQRNQRAEGRRAMWLDVGMEIEGRNDFGHIAIFDHPDNTGFPQPWRVDGQMGVGPVRARLGDWKINKGESETIKHRLVVYTGELNNARITRQWEQYADRGSMYSTTELWELAQQEGRNAEFLTPEAAVREMTVQDGFRVNVWAAEPMMTQPMAFTWDDRGRLWIAENRDYESRGDGFSSSGDSRILILEDTDRDGKADKRTVFLEGIAFPSALAVGFDGVFIGAPPNLLFVPDRDGDDKADVEDIEVRLTGWGIRDRHETLNSLTWGPDGWLYGLQGFATPSKVRKPEGKGRIYKHNDPFPEDILEEEGTPINGGVWRYHPVRDSFEVVAHGFSNPWGIDYDAKGQLLMSACVIPHLWHVIPGGIYHRQGGQHFNPYVYEDIKTIADHRHRSAHGGARVYLSDAFPEEQHGRIFMANIHEHAVLSDILRTKGSGFTSPHGEDFLIANNAQWVGFSMELGPDGSLYVLDWHDADICGKEVLNENTGRIFRIAPEKSQATQWDGRFADLSRLPDKQLVSMQTRNSAWHARRARVILQHRAARGELNSRTHQQLRDIFKNNANSDWRLRAMWGLHVTGGFDHQSLLRALDDRDEYIRAWAIQLLAEDKNPPESAIKKFEKMAQSDSSPVVRLYLASLLQRIDHTYRWNIIRALVQHGEDSDDHNIPKMIWFGLEPLVEQNPGRALQLVTESEIPLVTRHTARRTVDGGAMKTLVEAISSNTARPSVQLQLLNGMQDGLEGRTELQPPASWDQVYNLLLKSEHREITTIAGELAQQFGDVGATKKYFALLRDSTAPSDERRQALRALSEQQHPGVPEILPELLAEPGISVTAIRAVSEYDESSLGKLLIELYPAFSEKEKTETIQALASRPKYGWILTQALKSESVPREDVPAYTARQLMRVVGSGFIEVWGKPIEQSSNYKQQYARYKRLLTEKALNRADLRNGKSIFNQTCAPCHKMYGEGGTMGPDLTGSNRTNIDYILFNVLDPGADIQDDYKMVVVTTRGGRTYSGNIVTETDRQVTMRIVGQEQVVLNKSDIQSREETEVSMMPPGLFNHLTEQEVIDLVGYLREAGPETNK
ncbi:MAG: DUF6807 family protein [Balneolaceae bacterium]|nr:DUF6807 family protein [Balneolaceae bacterium]